VGNANPPKGTCPHFHRTNNAVTSPCHNLFTPMPSNPVVRVAQEALRTQWTQRQPCGPRPGHSTCEVANAIVRTPGIRVQVDQGKGNSCVGPRRRLPPKAYPSPCILVSSCLFLPITRFKERVALIPSCYYCLLCLPLPNFPRDPGSFKNPRLAHPSTSASASASPFSVRPPSAPCLHRRC
jgi:hypothetical protein